MNFFGPDVIVTPGFLRASTRVIVTHAPTSFLLLRKSDIGSNFLLRYDYLREKGLDVLRESETDVTWLSHQIQLDGVTIQTSTRAIVTRVLVGVTSSSAWPETDGLLEDRNGRNFVLNGVLALTVPSGVGQRTQPYGFLLLKTGKQLLPSAVRDGSDRKVLERSSLAHSPDFFFLKTGTDRTSSSERRESPPPATWMRRRT